MAFDARGIQNCQVENRENLYHMYSFHISCALCQRSLKTFFTD